MTPERWQQVSRIYHEAQALEPDAREAFVRSACHGDEWLRAEIELLLAQRSDDGFLEAAPDGSGATTTRAGQRLGPYTLEELLGAGGMGEVYRARDAKLGRDVAIKILPQIFTADADRQARFEREARLLAALNHANIGAIYGFEETDGLRGLVLEFIDGETLADQLRRGPLSITDALAHARAIAAALEAAHDKGIVHRDLKPANIKVTSDGTLKVLDFGLAKITGADPIATSVPTVSHEGMILGTPLYMSPEQARGKRVDKRTDIWAFGCLLYEMLTGHAAFHAETVADILSAIVNRDPDWTRLPPDLPTSVRRLLRRTLERDAARRLRDIGDAHIELDDAAEGGGTAAPASGITEVRRAVTRWRVIALASLGALTVGVGIAATIVWSRDRPETPAAPWSNSRAVSNPLTSYQGSESDGALAPDGRSFVFVSNRSGTTDIWLRQVSGGETGRLTNDPNQESDLAYAPDGETVYFTRTDGEGQSIWRVGILGGQPLRVASDGRAPALSADGRRLAYISGTRDDGTLAIIALDGAAVQTIARTLPGLGPALRWSPDGRWLSYTQTGLFASSNLFVFDVNTSEARQVTRFQGTQEGVHSHTWLDNHHLVVSYSPSRSQLRGGDLGILDVRDGSISRLTLDDGRARLDALSASSDGTRVMATVLKMERELWKVSDRSRSASPLRIIDRAEDPLWTFVSRDERTLLFNSPRTGSRNLWTKALDDDRPLRQITAIGGDAVTHSSLSPDGLRVAFASLAGGQSDIWTQRIDGSELRQLTNDAAADSWPVWSPDGQAIVFTSIREGRREAWRVAADGGPTEKLFDGLFRGDWARQPSGTGTWIVTSNGTNGVRLFDVEQRRLVWERLLGSGGGEFSLPMFSRDARRISVPHPEASDRDAIWILDAATGHGQPVVRFQEPFRIFFRADWVDGGQAFLVNRVAIVSHIVLFDRLRVD
jgi:eukaryotic-like serine/threonine-protein kinase